MQKEKGIALIIFIIIIVVILVVVGFFIYKYYSVSKLSIQSKTQNQQKQTINQQASNAQQTSSASSVPVACSAKYPSAEFPFLLSIPADFVNVNNLTAEQQNSLTTYMDVCLRCYNNPDEIDFCYTGKQTSDGFDAASLNIADSASISMQDCEKSEIIDPNIVQPQQKTINGIIFYNTQLNDAATGHYLSTDSYRIYHQGACYTIDLNIESDRGISENGLSADFSNMMNSKLKSILSTFQFTK
jgi:uncharacterized protein (UPF0333 family)